MQAGEEGNGGFVEGDAETARAASCWGRDGCSREAAGLGRSVNAAAHALGALQRLPLPLRCLVEDF